jgi:hypothetical protein
MNFPSPEVFEQYKGEKRRDQRDAALAAISVADARMRNTVATVTRRRQVGYVGRIDKYMHRTLGQRCYPCTSQRDMALVVAAINNLGSGCKISTRWAWWRSVVRLHPPDDFPGSREA